MSRENVEVVRAMWAAYARGDFEASLEAYAEDAVWDDTNYRPDGAVHVGRAALVALVETWREAWEPKTYNVEVEELHETGEDRVAVVLRETGRGRGGGVELANRWGQVATVRSGKIVHTMVYRTPEDALEAAGLRE
jgi:ketosteroid isomerase-like protein